MAKVGKVRDSRDLRNKEHASTYMKAAQALKRKTNKGGGTTASPRAQARAYARAGVSAVNKKHGTNFTAAGGGQG